MTPQLLKSIIEELLKIEFNVVAMVSDMGPTNRTLWNSLGISLDQTFFEHPITLKKIHVFADAPHLIKLARNHFINRYKIIFKYLIQMYFTNHYNFIFSGFLLENNKLIGKNVIEKVMNLCPNDLKLAHKLTESHINVPSSNKQNVRLAA